MDADTTFDFRTGVLCIILCFAVGLSNLFHVSILILFGALCMCVLPSPTLTTITSNSPQGKLFPHHLHRDSSPSPHLPHIREVRCLYAPLHHQLYAGGYLSRHGYCAVAQSDQRRVQSDRCGGVPDDHGSVLCDSWGKGTRLRRKQDPWWTGRRADDHLRATTAPATEGEGVQDGRRRKGEEYEQMRTGMARCESGMIGD